MAGSIRGGQEDHCLAAKMTGADKICVRRAAESLSVTKEDLKAALKNDVRSKRLASLQARMERLQNRVGSLDNDGEISRASSVTPSREASASRSDFSETAARVQPATQGQRKAETDMGVSDLEASTEVILLKHMLAVLYCRAQCVVASPVQTSHAPKACVCLCKNSQSGFQRVTGFSFSGTNCG